MRQRHNPLRIWRRYHIGRWTFSIALVTVLMASVLTGGALIHASPSKTARVQRSATWPKRPSVKDEGAWFQLSHFDNKTPPANGRSLALQQAAKLPVSRIGATVKTGGAASGSGISTSATWAPLGPQPIACGDSSCGNTSFDSGRITAIAVNPLSGSDIWVGAADGGLWHSTDGGSTWATVTDNQPTLSIGSIAIDVHTGSPYTIYAGTGEGNGNADAYWGDGVLKSTDGGATWTLYGQTSLSGLGIPRIAVDPFNSNYLLAAVDYTAARNAPNGNWGIWRSTDAGQTWTLLNVGGPNVLGSDVVFDPTRNGVAYAGVAGAGIYETTDHGVTWNLLGGLPNGANWSRVGLGISANGNYLYAVIAGGSNGSGRLLNSAIYTGAFSGSTWTWTSHPVAATMADDHGEYQWWYDIYAMVDPTVSAGTTAYIGGVDLWKTTDGGVNWTNVTDYYNNLTDVHPDQHALAFLPGSSSYYIGNDGGIWKGTSSGSFTNLNGGGLNITQFYSGSIGEIGGNAQLYGGAQDNGEIQYPVGAVTGATTWTEVYGGDGGDTAVDYTDNTYVYEEYVYLAISKSIVGGNPGMGWLPASNGINVPSGSNCAATSSCDAVNFIAPFVMSPTNPNVLVAGTDRVYLTSDGAQNWHAISPVLDTPCSNCVAPLSALAIGGSNQYIYAGDNGGNVYVTTNGGGSWSGGALATIESGLITGLAVDPTNPSVAYASLNGFAGSSGPGLHLYKTTNAGASWSDVSASLPDIPFESVAVNPANHNEVVVGTDAGVFISADAGATWARLGTGLPNAAINQVFFDHTGGSLFVATHGRGMWTLAIPQIATNPTSLLETTPVNTNAAQQTFTLTDSGTGTLNWTTSNLPSWVANVSPSSGSLAPGASQQVTVTYNTSGISSPQTLKGSITISDPNAGNSPYSVPIQIVVDNISKTWYFAEGHTGDTFTEFLTLENPNNSSTNVQVQYLLGGGQSPISATYVVGANARSTIRVNNEVGAPQDVSMVVTASQPIVAERPLYFTYNGLPGYSIPGGSDVLGATSLNSSFDFGYLDTSTGHDTWLTVLNQNSSAMDVHVSYYPAAGGSPIVRIHTFAANSRGTIHVNREGLPAGSYSALVSLTQQGNTTPALGLVERPLYLVDSSTGDSGSADVVGVSQPLSSWYFAEGYTGPTFAERYILSNPGNSSVSATVTFYLAGGGTQSANVSIAAGAQAVVNANSVLGSSVNNSAVVTSTGGPILAERFMSFNYNGGVGGGPGIPGGIQGASDVLGASAPAQLFEFAEGYTGPTFAEYLTLENPNNQVANVTVRYLPQSGGAPTVVTYTLPANSRTTIYTNRVMYNQSFSMEVLSDQPIVAERPMYFSFSGGYGPQNGGSDVIGYAP